MKKNRFMRLASCLLILCLITTCAISTTFAKYVSSDSASDTARVAKWGITVSTSGTLFGKNYAATSVGTGADEIVSSTSESVSATTNVVAPGTKNDVGFKISITGKPEVAYDVVATAVTDKDNEDIYLKAGRYGVLVDVSSTVNEQTFEPGKYYVENAGGYVIANTYSATLYELHDEVDFATGSDYYPIAWEVNSTPVSDIKTQMNTIISDIDAMAGTPASAELNVAYHITWSWAINKGNTDAEKLASKKDTILGNLIAGSGATNVVVWDTTNSKFVKLSVDGNKATANGEEYANLDVTLSIDIVVSQVD